MEYSLLDDKDHLSGAIDVGGPLYNQVLQFLYEEAALLDDGRMDLWLKLLDRDFAYDVPIRTLVRRSQGMGFDRHMKWIADDYEAVAFKVKRFMETDTAWVEDPPSFCRRSVSNLLLSPSDDEDTYLARTSLLVYRKRGAEQPKLISAMRNDLIRRGPDGWRLAKRSVLLDQSVFDMNNIAIFL